MNRTANEPKLATEKCTLWFELIFNQYFCVYNYVHHYAVFILLCRTKRNAQNNWNA